MVVVVLERHVLCAFGGQVSEARVECTFLANDAAYLTLSRAVTQLRRSEIVTPGVGLTVCVVCGVSNEKVGFGRAFSLHSQSECIMFDLLLVVWWCVCGRGEDRCGGGGFRATRVVCVRRTSVTGA